MAVKHDVRYVQYCTDGSSARKLAPAYPGGKPERVAKVRKQKRILIHVDPVAVAGIFVAVMMLLMMVIGISSYNAAQQHTAQMESYVQRLQARNDALTESYASGYDIEQVQKMALALGMVPQEQVEHVSIQVSVPQIGERPGTWERFTTFLAGLFA